MIPRAYHLKQTRLILNIQRSAVPVQVQELAAHLLYNSNTRKYLLGANNYKLVPLIYQSQLISSYSIITNAIVFIPKIYFFHSQIIIIKSRPTYVNPMTC